MSKDKKEIKSAPKESKKYSKEIIELVKFRLQAMPKNVSISIGSDGSFNRDDLVERVIQCDDIGKKMIELDLEFLRALKTGELQKNVNYETQA